MALCEGDRHIPLVNASQGPVDKIPRPARSCGNPGRDRLEQKTGTMNPVKALENHGQAVWLDFLARGFVAKGDLQKLIDADGVKGVTSNPSIF